MKYLKVLFCSVPFILFAATTHVFAHGDKHKDKAAVYEATETEFGSYDPEMKNTRVIEVTMSDDMSFTPNSIVVKKGEIIEFVHENTGKLTHEFVLGTEESLMEHAAMMMKFPNMEHEEPYMLHVPAGEKGSMKWKFSTAGTFGFGCLVPGHYDAGMKGTLTVEDI